MADKADLIIKGRDDAIGAKTDDYDFERPTDGARLILAAS
jgi:hypothetical protein